MQKRHPKPSKIIEKLLVFKAFFDFRPFRKNAKLCAKMMPKWLEIWSKINQKSMHKSIEKATRHLRSKNRPKIDPWSDRGRIFRSEWLATWSQGGRDAGIGCSRAPRGGLACAILQNNDLAEERGRRSVTPWAEGPANFNRSR